MCGFNCSECAFPDCTCDLAPTTKELNDINEIDAAIDYENREDQARINGTIQYFKYNHSEKGKANIDKYNHSEKGKSRICKYNNSEKGKEAVKRYNSSEKGKSRFKKYYESEKGKANAKRQNEKRKLQRLQQKGAKDER